MLNVARMMKSNNIVAAKYGNLIFSTNKHSHNKTL